MLLSWDQGTVGDGETFQYVFLNSTQLLDSSPFHPPLLVVISAVLQIFLTLWLPGTGEDFTSWPPCPWVTTGWAMISSGREDVCGGDVCHHQTQHVIAGVRLCFLLSRVPGYTDVLE